ncbi:MAG: rhomboid family intramembrane serine protease [Pseudomonadota bacterium]
MSKESIFGDASPPGVVWALTGVFIAFELAFALANAGVLPIADLRWQIYLKLAFFDLYFEGVRDGQAVPWWFWTSFLSYSVIHGGLLHLAMNGVFFVAVGGMVAKVIGATKFLILFAVTAVGGALVFGLLANSQGPMVGASGALFGLIGALKAWEWRYIRLTGASADRFWRTIIALAAMNLLLAVAFPGEGSLAWEAHLGGFLAGFLIAPVLAPRLAGPSPI